MCSHQPKQHLHMVHELYKGDVVGITNTDQHAGCVHPLNSARALSHNVWCTHGVYKLCSVIRATAAFYGSLLRREAWNTFREAMLEAMSLLPLTKFTGWTTNTNTSELQNMELPDEKQWIKSLAHLHYAPRILGFCGDLHLEHPSYYRRGIWEAAWLRHCRHHCLRLLEVREHCWVHGGLQLCHVPKHLQGSLGWWSLSFCRQHDCQQEQRYSPAPQPQHAPAACVPELAQFIAHTCFCCLTLAQRTMSSWGGSMHTPYRAPKNWSFSCFIFFLRSAPGKPLLLFSLLSLFSFLLSESLQYAWNPIVRGCLWDLLKEKRIH